MMDRRTLLGHGALLSLAGTPLAHAMPQAMTPPRVFRSPIRLEGSRVLLDASIGARSFAFLIDTGAPWSLIDNELAKSLRFKKLPGTRRVVGVGGISELPWYDAGEVRFGGGIRLPNMLFVGARPGAFSGDVVGTFGSGLFTSHDSDLDFGRGEWRTYPDGRPDFAGLAHIPSRFITGRDGAERIEADATVGGYQGEFLVDTGAPGEVSLGGKAAEKSGLWSDDRPYAPMQARGIGKGRVPTRLVRVDRTKVGPFVFEDPLVSLTKPGQPSGAQDGIIGLSLLKLLNLTTQVSSRSLWAAPSGVVRGQRSYPMSGLWLGGEGNRITIDEVGTGSPAAEAGLKVGDKVVGAEIGAMIRQITRPAGTTVPMTIERDGQRRDVVLTLRPYL
jgi:predicted aspartyl protease